MSSDDASDPMRVCLLNPCYWPEVQRGSERVIRELATYLLGRGHRVRLLTGHPGPPSRSVEEGLAVWRLPRILDGYLARRQVQEYVTHLPWSYLALRAGTDDVAYAAFPTDACAALRWRERSRKPVVFSYNGLPSRPVFASRRGRFRVLTEAIYGADELVVPSQASADEMERWFGRRPLVIHPGVDLDRFRPGPGRDETPTIACLAPWEDTRKRVPLVVEAFAEVRRRRPEARLLLLRPEDPRAARELASADGIELVDWSPDPASVARLYRRAWVSVLASYNEAFGLVLLEALACGTPVVAENAWGPKEIVTSPEVGRLFDGDRPAAVAEAILDALELQGNGASCREAAARFNTTRCGAEHERLFRKLVRNAARLPA